MRKVVLFIAMSLDGYIADKNGKVDWPTGEREDVETDDGYRDFVKDIDTVIMGWRTYHQIVTELSPEQWLYDDLQCYVFTQREHLATPNIRFLSNDPCSLINELKEEEGKDIWICGGADIVRQIMEKDLIDIYRISVIPTILGEGVRLFPDKGQEIRLNLEMVRNSNGITELIYRKR